jgi:hypothetical protein
MSCFNALASCYFGPAPLEGRLIRITITAAAFDVVSAELPDSTA